MVPVSRAPGASNSGIVQDVARTYSRPPLQWGAADAKSRGPVVATLRNPDHRNVIGTHAGGYSVYRALAVAARALHAGHVADLSDTAPANRIGPHPQWAEPGRIVSIDPWGHLIGSAFRDYLEQGYDIRPTIAVTRAHIDVPEIRAGIEAGRIRRDGTIVSAQGSVRVMKVAIDPVWYLPGIAERFGISESELRRDLHEQTAGMYPELVTRDDLKVLLPPIGFYALEALGFFSVFFSAFLYLGVAAAVGGHDGLLLRRSGQARRQPDHCCLPRPRRV
jgi:hypothetical protein